MSRVWRWRLLRFIGVGAMVAGAGLVVVAPANAAPVADAAALRQAINGVNGTGAATQIELVPNTTYSLPGPDGCADEDGNKSGDLDIRRSQALKIFTPDGQLPAILEMTCDAATSPQRVIQVLPPDNTGTPTGKLTLRNVVIRNGHAPNLASEAGFGGGVAAKGAVALENTVFENNTAGTGIAGLPNAVNGQPGGSGGAVSASSITIDGSTFTGNKSGNGGNGAAFARTGNPGPCTGKAGGEGGAGGQGGAVFAFAGLTVTNSTFTGNQAGNGGNGGDGGCAIVGAAATGAAGGNGGVAGSGGAVQCGFVLLDRGLGCNGPMKVTGSTMSGNATGNGGNAGAGGDGPQAGAGGNGGAAGITGRGGAIRFVGGRTTDGPTKLRVENSTLDGNINGIGGNGGNGGAGTTGGKAGNGGSGGRAGAVAAGYPNTVPGEVASLIHITATENGAGGTGGTAGQPGAGTTTPGGAGTPGDNGGGSLAFTNPWESVATVVGTSAGTGDGPDCFGQTATTNSFNRSTDDVCGFGAGSLQEFAAFALGSMSDNGGPTKTRLPAAASGLVDKVTPASAGPLPADQRGVKRPQVAGSDIGAVEVQLIDLVVTKKASATSVAAGTTVTFTITTKNTGTSSPQPGVTLDDPNCSNMSAATGDANTNTTLDPGETFTYTCTAKPTTVGTFTNTVTATIVDGAGVKITRVASADVTVTAGAGSTPPLAKTGANNPTPLLLTGAGLIGGGVLLLLLGRPQRIRVRATTR